MTADTIDTIVFEVTHRCNLHCVYCFYEERLGDRQFLPVDAIARFLEDVPRHTRIKLTGGEVFVHRQAPEIIRTIRSMGFRLAITTNAFRSRRGRRLIEWYFFRSR